MGLTDQMTPYGRGPRRRRPVLLAALVVLVAAVSVGVTVLVTGDGGGGRAVVAASPPPSAAPTRFGIPSPAPSAPAPTLGGLVVLPAPTATSPNGVPLGFPPTTEGAVSAIVRWKLMLVPVDENRQVTVLGEVGTQEFLRTTLPLIRASYRTETRPPGFWAISTPLAYAVVSTGEGTVEVAVLSLAQTGDATGAVHSELRRDGFQMRWSDTDWRLDALLFKFSTPDAPQVPPSQSREDLRAAGWKEYLLA